MLKIYWLSSIALFLALTMACDDLRRYKVYTDIEHATADGAFARGWLPEWIPPSAKNIHEFHDLDTNEQAISFEVQLPNTFVWPAECRVGVEVPHPRLRTKLFPASVSTLNDIRNCSGLFTTIDHVGLVHAWGMQERS